MIVNYDPKSFIVQATGVPWPFYLLSPYARLLPLVTLLAMSWLLLDMLTKIYMALLQPGSELTNVSAVTT